MSECWCKTLQDYICCECESKQAWSKLSDYEKMKLLAYKKCINTGNFQKPEYRDLILYISNKNLDLGMVPSGTTQL